MRDTPPDFSATLGQGVAGWRIAWSPDLGYAGVDPEVVRVIEMAARVFEELGAVVETPGLSIEDPFESFWEVFSTASYTSYGHLLEERRDDFTYYGLRAFDRGAAVTGRTFPAPCSGWTNCAARWRYFLTITTYC